MDVAEEMMRLTRTVVLRALLGADLGPFASTIDEAWTIINEHVGESFWSLGFTDRLPTPKYRRFQAARAVLRGAVDHVISRTPAQPVRQRRSALHADVGARRRDRRGDDRRAAARRGHDVPAGGPGDDVAGADVDVVSAVAAPARARQRLEDEIDAVLDGRPPEYADLANLPYTRMVIDEAMRLYPPAWGFSRQALADDELGGFRLPRGWLAFVIPYVLHRLPAFWQDPEAFDPERFLPERSADRPKFVYLPFGAGPRQCIGNQFALIEAQLSVATLAQSYRLHLVPGTGRNPWPLITLRPRFGMPMIIERRTRSPVRAGRHTSLKFSTPDRCSLPLGIA